MNRISGEGPERQTPIETVEWIAHVRQDPESVVLADSRNCVVCCQMFTPSGRQTTCSRECRRAHRKALRKQRWEKLSPEENAQRLAKDNARRLLTVHVCEQCGSEFYPRKDGQQYCGRQCSDAARRKACPEPTAVELAPDPQAEQRFKQMVAELKGCWGTRRPFARRSYYAPELEELGLPLNVREAAKSLGVSCAALSQRIHRHIHHNPAKVLAPKRQYRRRSWAVSAVAKPQSKRFYNTAHDILGSESGPIGTMVTDGTSPAQATAFRV